MNEKIITIGCLDYPETIITFDKNYTRIFSDTFINAWQKLNKNLITDKQALAMIKEASVKAILDDKNIKYYPCFSAVRKHLKNINKFSICVRIFKNFAIWGRYSLKSIH